MDLAVGVTVVIVFTPTCAKRNLLGSVEDFEAQATFHRWKVLLSKAADANGPWDSWTLLLVAPGRLAAGALLVRGSGVFETAAAARTTVVAGCGAPRGGVITDTVQW
jgi:hypothetical protein